MNVWNLIDGMDGLASGVGLLVSGTLTLVAIHNENYEVAVMAVALAGSLAGFLLYNWHPACIFLGDSGALLIGLLIGVIGVEGSMEGPSAISILFPILAMGLPISDTAMAIFSRWVRNLPLSAADRRHVHHLLIGLGLNPRQAALMLYCFSGFLCGAVMLGVALRNEYLTLVLGISGCLVFLLVVTSRRDELTSLRGDLQERMKRKRQERQAAKLAWEAIQRVELCTTAQAAYEIVDQTAHAAGLRAGAVHVRPRRCVPGGSVRNPCEVQRQASAVSGPSAIFRLSSGQGRWLTVSLGLPTDSSPAADIVFRYLQRLSIDTGRAAGLAPVEHARERRRGARRTRFVADVNHCRFRLLRPGDDGTIRQWGRQWTGSRSTKATRLLRFQPECANFARDEPGRGEDNISLHRRPCAVASGWCSLSPCPWRSLLRSWCSGFRRSTWPRARSRSTPRPSTLSSRHS